MARYAVWSVRTLAGLLLVLAAALATAEELVIPDHGVGSNVVDRELEGRATRFGEGSRVWFWTRVVGASEGDAIRHVWLQGAEERLTVELAVNGSPWRTYSHKTLHPGSAGGWSVEARDAEGRVLARDTFECGPPAPEAPADEADPADG